MRINQKIHQEDNEQQIAQDRVASQLRNRSFGKDTRPKEDEPVYFGQKFDVRPTALLGGGFTSNELPGRLGIQSEDPSVAEEEQLIKKITSDALKEKLREIVAEEKQKDEKLKDSLFKPVEAISVKDILQSRNQEREEQASRSRAQGPQNLADNKDLSNLLAENMLNLFTNAIQHINTSLVKNLGNTQTRDGSPHKSIHELFGRKKEPTIAYSDARNRVTIEEEEPRGGFRREERKEQRPGDDSVLNKLASEAKRTVEESELLREHKPINIEFYAEKPRERIAVSPQSNQFYFYNHEPKPIADYSGYLKELESESSSFGIRSEIRNNKIAWDTGSESVYRSEGHSGTEGVSDLEY